MRKNIAIESALPMDGRCWKIGEEVNGIKISKIRDNSIEGENVSEIIFDILDENNKIIQSIINMSVIVSYEEG